MSDDDLLADTQSVENQPEGEQQPAGETENFDRGPPPSEVQYPDWVPTELQSAEKRQELLDALGIKNGATLPAERPDFVPEKFWKEGEGLQLENAMKSYSELEKKMHEKRPEPPEAYDLKPPDGVELGEDTPLLSEQDTELFKDLGLDNDSAQKVMNHYWENVVPALMEERGKAELANLANDWDIKRNDDGSFAPEFKERLGKVKAWAEKNLPEEAQQHLRKSASGIQAMYKMMEAGANVAPDGGSGQSGMSESELQSAINSDRYWQDEGYRNQISREFQRRYGSGG